MIVSPKTLDPAAATPRFDTKVVVVLGEGLAAWQELNVTAFLISGIATSSPGLIGAPYIDGDRNQYLPMLREPVLILNAALELLRRARARAVARDDVALAIYTRSLFTTGHDDANRAEVAAVAAEDLELVGIGLRGPRNVVDRIVKGARFHE